MAAAIDKIDAAMEAVLNRGMLRHVFSISPDIVVCFYFAPFLKLESPSPRKPVRVEAMSE